MRTALRLQRSNGWNLKALRSASASRQGRRSGTVRNVRPAQEDAVAGMSRGTADGKSQQDKAQKERQCYAHGAPVATQ